MFPYYTQAPKAADSAVKADLRAEDEAALKMLKSKSEMRKVGKGLIKMKVGQVDEREVCELPIIRKNVADIVLRW